MWNVRMNLLEAEAVEEMNEATGVISEAGGGGTERYLWLRSIFAAGRSVGRQETMALARVPAVGEYVCLPLEEDVWYRVEAVLHTPGQATHVAEIWAFEGAADDVAPE
ncbi:MAG: hypothetical protein SFU56_20065 [Capsulimonadales bacterium]|nr:hypothetical protein [Capsulimonadales bacterium]